MKAIIANNPKLKHLEIYPSFEFSKDLPPEFKMVVGNYVPDFLIFGLKIKKSSAVAIEIDGDSHIQKWSKDKVRNDHLRQLKIFTFEVPNDQAMDINFLTTAILKMYRLRNGSFNDQVKRVKRSIWAKTISCQLSIAEIEIFIKEKFSIPLNLKEEIHGLVASGACPRKIRRELPSLA